MHLRKRLAFSLVELLVALAAASTVMLVAVEIIDRSFRLHRTSRDSSQHAATMERLVWQLRQDCSRADKLKMPNSTSLEFKLDRALVTYSIMDDSGTEVSRRVVDSGGAKAFDAFNLGENIAVLENSTETSGQLLIYRPTVSKVQPQVLERFVELATEFTQNTETAPESTKEEDSDEP